jgi:8-oxo-dGTP diphosphatase
MGAPPQPLPEVLPGPFPVGRLGSTPFDDPQANPGPVLRWLVPRYPPCPKLTVDAFWVTRGRLLLVRRKHDPFAGHWALPGGFVEAGESTPAAVMRELHEETGLRAKPVDIVGVYSDPHRDPRGHSVSVTYRMTGRAGTPRGGDDAAEAAWVDLGALPPLAFDHGAMVTDGLRLLAAKHARVRSRLLRGGPPPDRRGGERRKPDQVGPG